MASNKKLNPNAAPYCIFPHHLITRRASEQVVMAPFQSVFVYHQPVPNWGYPFNPTPFLFNLNSQTNYFVPSDSGKGFDLMTDGGFGYEYASDEFNNAEKRGKMKYIAPRFRSKKKIVSVGEKEQQWLPKKLTIEETKLSKKEIEFNLGGKTSLMIRNLPNQFQRHNLLQILDKHCLEDNKNKSKGKSAYDFLYLPMDFKTGGNFGYAFVNFTNCVGAIRFYKAFNNHEWDVPVNRKTCKVCCANIQGKVAFVNHFKNSVFSCSRSDFLPVVLSPPSDGVVCSRVIVIGRHRETKMNSSHSGSGHASKD